MSVSETLNMDYMEEQYRRWKTDPGSVSRDFQYFFKGFELADAGTALGPDAGGDARAAGQSGVESLIYRHRDLGHLLACMDPLAACPTSHPLLDLEAFGLSLEDLDREFATPMGPLKGKGTLKEILRTLRETYCRSIGVEYIHIQDPGERRWLRERMESSRNRADMDDARRIRILKKLLQSTLFEKFLNKKFVGVTRFSLEGGDAVIPLLDAMVQRAAGASCDEIILGMAHRGRLNVQVNILKKPYEEIFEEFESCYDPSHLTGAGDVKYHNGYLADIRTGEGAEARIYLVNNPSHLEAVNPVVQGVARARQDLSGKGENRILPVQIHGDAAFAGQGIVAETLNMSQLAGYRTGGTIHLVINNQIGYTTLPEDARSTRYSTDVAKMLLAPVFHVHGEDPEAAVHAAELALEYRNAFHKDVVIDLICYRRYGHNEGDEPYFTQPTMYDRIRLRPSLDKVYEDALLEEGVIEKETVKEMAASIRRKLDDAFEEVNSSSCPFPMDRFFENWDGFHGRYSHEPAGTGVEESRLVSLARKLNSPPEDFSIHPKLDKLLKKRMSAVENGSGLDWANAEALAFASLLEDGFSVRLSGQDVGRGTFSQRHATLYDVETGGMHVPLSGLGGDGARFQVYNSLLAEAGVLGFEYGYSITDPRCLTLWEAQFGDFANGAQNIIDLFIASGESKWRRLSGLALLLPHGWEGLGPEHSSARLERFLQLCAGDNMQVCNLTTPAQYFHLLRRQVTAGCRKPLVLMTPKSLLRHPMATSILSDLETGVFEPVIDDPAGGGGRVLICSGKIYYQLLRAREEKSVEDAAIIRLEQFYPFPEARLMEAVKRRPGAERWIWVQEEPKNMGAWWFVKPRLENIIGKPLEYVGREPASSPATGFPRIYKREQAAISEKAFGD